MASRSIERGQVRKVECLGQPFVLWRSRDAGDVHALHAYCPHLGANLAHGCVRGDRIECPFHAWQFTGDGRAASVPYSENVPPGVLTDSFPIEEVHGGVYLYWRNGTDRQAVSPPYPAPRIEEVDDGQFVRRGFREFDGIRMHIMEFAENSVDRAHFPIQHTEFRLPGPAVKVPRWNIDHRTEWWVNESRPWVAHLRMGSQLKILGRNIGGEIDTRISFVGPAIIDQRVHIPGRGVVEIRQTVLPVAPLELSVQFTCFADRKLPRLLVWYVMSNMIAQLTPDTLIWENKVHLEHPRLCHDDGPIFSMRRWFDQFLPEPAGMDPPRGRATRQC